MKKFVIMMHFCHEDLMVIANFAEITFHLGLHCLSKYMIAGIQNEKGSLQL